MRKLVQATFVILLGLVCAASDTPATHGVHVEVLNARCAKKKLLLSWRITNNESKPIYVYATFLKGPAAGFEEAEKGVLTLHTSLKGKIHAGVNFYPKAEFTELAPLSSLEGKLEDKQICTQLPTPKPRDVSLDVAYGFEVAQVKKSLQSGTNADEHPANPIVNWRALAQSKPAPLRGTTR